MLTFLTVHDVDTISGQRQIAEVQAMPGYHNKLDLTLDQAGTYLIRCLEFCGLNHWSMYFSVRVVPEDEYDAWLDEQRAAADDGGDE